MVTAFGCLGGALMIAMLSPCSSFAVLSYILSYDFSDSLILRGQNTSCVSQLLEAGVTPQTPRGRAPVFRGGGGRPPPPQVFGRGPIFPLPSPSCPFSLALFT